MDPITKFLLEEAIPRLPQNIVSSPKPQLNASGNQRRNRSVPDMLSSRYGCDKKENYHDRRRCMLNSKLLELKKRLNNCRDPKCKEITQMQINKWIAKQKQEYGNLTFRVEKV